MPDDGPPLSPDEDRRHEEVVERAWDLPDGRGLELLRAALRRPQELGDSVLIELWAQEVDELRGRGGPGEGGLGGADRENPSRGRGVRAAAGRLSRSPHLTGRSRTSEGTEKSRSVSGSQPSNSFQPSCSPVRRNWTQRNAGPSPRQFRSWRLASTVAVWPNNHAPESWRVRGSRRTASTLLRSQSDVPRAGMACESPRPRQTRNADYPSSAYAASWRQVSPLRLRTRL